MSAGTKYTPPVSGTALRERPRLGSLLDDPEPVAQPLDRRAGDEDGTLERVHDLAAGPARERHEQALGRRRRLLAGVHEHERSGAVGVLRHAGLEARLTEQRRLLVAGDPG